MDKRQRNYANTSCHKCSKMLLKKNESLLCKSCKQSYCLDCQNVSDKRYCLMTKEHKEKYICIACLSQGASSNSHGRRDDYATYKNNNRKVLTPSDSETSCATCESDFETTSLPDLSTDGGPSEVQELRQQIIDLQTQLKSANAEVDRLTLENTELRNKTKGNESKINTLKKICNDKISTTKKSGKKSRKNRINKRKLDFTIDVEDQSKNTSLISDNSTNSTSAKIQDLVDGRQESNSAVSETLNKSKMTQPDSKSKIYFFGSQQCRGLAKAISIDREDSPYKDYQIFSFIKPNAKSDEIVRSMRAINFKHEDLVVLCLGENDTNPTRLTAELCFALKLCQNCSVIVLGVFKSSHLNENMINSTFKTVCGSFPNCEFLDSNPDFLSRKAYLAQTAKAINFSIDCRDYDNSFIKNIKSLLHKNNITQNSKLPSPTPITKMVTNKLINTPTNQNKNNFFRPSSV